MHNLIFRLHRHFIEITKTSTERGANGKLKKKHTSFEQLTHVYTQSDVKFSENKITSSQTLGKLHELAIKCFANELFLLE